MIEGQNSEAGAVILRAREEHERQLREMRQQAIAAGSYLGEAERLRREHGEAYQRALAEFNEHWRRKGEEVQGRITALEHQAQQAEAERLRQLDLSRAQQAAERKAEEIRKVVSGAEAEARRLGVSVESYLLWKVGNGAG